LLFIAGVCTAAFRLYGNEPERGQSVGSEYQNAKIRYDATPVKRAGNAKGDRGYAEILIFTVRKINDTA